MDMRFISICTVNSTSRLPTEAEMASMQKLIVEGMKAGWLLECEGVTFGATGVRVHKAADGWFEAAEGNLMPARARYILISRSTQVFADRRGINSKAES
jgi:hypothetical protein